MSNSGVNDSPEQRLAAARTWAADRETQVVPGQAVPSGSGQMAQVTGRLQTVIEAAERAADAIRHDAEEQARRHLAEAQHKADRLTTERVKLISQLTDDLIEHASVVKQHSEEMVGALEQAISTVSGRIAEVDSGAPAGLEPPLAPLIDPAPAAATPAPTAAAPGPPAAATPAPAPERRSRPESPPPTPAQVAPSPDPARAPARRPHPPPSSSVALLGATQLAVGGGDR